jgi:hypothetical protein
VTELPCSGTEPDVQTCYYYITAGCATTEQPHLIICSYSNRTVCSELCEVGVVMSSSGGAQLNWGNRLGRENGMGRERGGGGQFTINMGPGWTRIAPYKEEGFQVSKRDSGARGVSKGIAPWLSIVNLYICIMLLCECS